MEQWGVWMMAALLCVLMNVANNQPSTTVANGWHGPINMEYSDEDCPNVGCHGPWKGVTGPEVCEGICDGLKRCNAMNYANGGCCLRACAPGRQITANKTGGGGCSYYRLGPAPPPCAAVKDKTKCLKPCIWNSFHCRMPLDVD